MARSSIGQSSTSGPRRLRRAACAAVQAAAPSARLAGGSGRTGAATGAGTVMAGGPRPTSSRRAPRWAGGSTGAGAGGAVVAAGGAVVGAAGGPGRCGGGGRCRDRSGRRRRRGSGGHGIRGGPAPATRWPKSAASRRASQMTTGGRRMNAVVRNNDVASAADGHRLIRMFDDEAVLITIVNAHQHHVERARTPARDLELGVSVPAEFDGRTRWLDDVVLVEGAAVFPRCCSAIRGSTSKAPFLLEGVSGRRRRPLCPHARRLVDRRLKVHRRSRFPPKAAFRPPTRRLLSSILRAAPRRALHE